MPRASRVAAWTGLFRALGVCAMLSVAGCDAKGSAADGHESAPALPSDAVPIAPPLPLPQPTAAPAAAAGSVSVKLEPVSFAPIAHAADPSVVTITTVTEEDMQVSASSRTAGNRATSPQPGNGLHLLDAKVPASTSSRTTTSSKAPTRSRSALFDDREYPGKVVGTDLADRHRGRAHRREHLRRPASRRLGHDGRRRLGRRHREPLPRLSRIATVSAGIVSAKGRTLAGRGRSTSSGYYDFIQTVDASINPGNSGGSAAQPPQGARSSASTRRSVAAARRASGSRFRSICHGQATLVPMLLRDGHVTAERPRRPHHRRAPVSRATTARGAGSSPKASTSPAPSSSTSTPARPADKGRHRARRHHRRLRRPDHRTFRPGSSGSPAPPA